MTDGAGSITENIMHTLKEVLGWERAPNAIQVRLWGSKVRVDACGYADSTYSFPGTLRCSERHPLQRSANRLGDPVTDQDQVSANWLRPCSSCHRRSACLAHEISL